MSESLGVPLFEIFQQAHRGVDGKRFLGPGFEMAIERSPDRRVIAGIERPVSDRFRRDRPEVAAIVDWEMATVGDPLIDLGWLLATWPDKDGHGVINIAQCTGLPAAEDLLARYADTAARGLAHINWYVTFARFKLAIVLEGTHVRACAGKVDAALGRRLNETARSLMAKATERIGFVR